MTQRCACCRKNGTNVAVAKPLTAAGRRRNVGVVFCRKCDRFDLWPNVRRKKGATDARS